MERLFLTKSFGNCQIDLEKLWGDNNWFKYYLQSKLTVEIMNKPWKPSNTLPLSEQPRMGGSIF